jgi:hypothetical protein
VDVGSSKIVKQGHQPPPGKIVLPCPQQLPRRARLSFPAGSGQTRPAARRLAGGQDRGAKYYPNSAKGSFAKGAHHNLSRVCGPKLLLAVPPRMFNRPRLPKRTKVGLTLPYRYGRIICMKKTLHIDDVLLRDARSASKANTDTETVRLGLEALIRQAAYQRLRALRGTEPGARDVPRRRERAASTKHSTS